MVLNEFWLKYLHFNGQKLSGFLSLHNFWIKKCKNQFFEENKGCECSFFRIEVQMISNPSSQTFDYLHMNELL